MAGQLASLAAAVTFLAPAAPAQDKLSDKPIIVVAPTEKEQRREVAEFVRELGIANGERPVARWTEPVCPKVTGLQPEHASIVESRVRSTARLAGARVGGTRCETNISIVFTGNAGSVARTIRTKAPTRLAEVPVTDRSSLFEGSAPIRWWYSTEVTDSSGIPASTAPAPWTAGNSDSGGSVIPMNDSSTTLNHYGSSLLSTQIYRALRTATILVDANLAEGHNLSSVADFVALVSLAEIDLGASPPNSILGLFANGDGQRITERDQQFLQALYSLPLDRRSRQQRARLVNDMLKPQRDD